jgi:prepilin-type N-terminal cleavage/methylation domain-containing protein
MKTIRQRRQGVGRRGRSGFTIVEIIVAIVVLLVGVLGLASSAAVVSRLIGGGAQQALAANVAQSRFEILRSRPCNMIVDGSAGARGVTEQWRVEPVAVRMYDVEVVVTYSTPGGPRQPQAYRSHVICRS